MSRPGSVVAVALAALLLAGCAPQPIAETTPPAATSTPTPTASAVALPSPTLELTCADILSDAEASEILQTPVQLRVDEDDLRNIRDIAMLQSGVLSCIWGGDGKTDNGWNESLVLNVLPDATADYDAGVMQVDDGAVVYTAGELSEYLCYVDGDYSQCAANILIDGFWAQVLSHAAGPASGRTQATADAGMANLLDGLAEDIPAAAPAPGWSLPAGVVRGAFCDDESASTAAVRESFATSGFVPSSEPNEPPFRADQVGVMRSETAYCAWTSPGDGYLYAGVTVVPGGAWSFPSLVANPPVVSYSIPQLQPVEVAGADTALSACGDECYLLASAGGSAIVVTGPVTPDFLTAAGTLLASVVAAG